MQGGREAVTRAREVAEGRRDGILARREGTLITVRALAEKRMLDCGITRNQLARRAGLKPPTLSDFLNGGGIHPENLTQLCGALRDLRDHAVNASVLAEAEALAATG